MVLAFGLNNLVELVVNNWLGPIYFIVVVFFAIKYLKDGELRKILQFIAMAVIVGVLVFGVKELLGKDSGLNKGIKDTIKEAVGSGN